MPVPVADGLVAAIPAVIRPEVGRLEVGHLRAAAAAAIRLLVAVVVAQGAAAVGLAAVGLAAVAERGRTGNLRSPSPVHAVARLPVHRKAASARRLVRL